jgi:hypothetical protein
MPEVGGGDLEREELRKIGVDGSEERVRVL